MKPAMLFLPCLALTLLALTLSIGLFAGCPDPASNNSTGVTPINTTVDKSYPGQSTYESNCASCHGQTGHGASSMVIERQVEFDNPDWQKRYTDAQVMAIIKDGKGLMPAFGSSISDAELKTLVSYVRRLSDLKHD